jgi:hypothetical protein
LLYVLFFDTTNIHTPSAIRTHNLSSQAAEDPRLRLCGHWDRQQEMIAVNICISSFFFKFYALKHEFSTGLPSLCGVGLIDGCA